MLGDVWAFRFALLNLVLKDFRIRYRNMSLGIMWSVINPLVMLGVLVFVFTFVYPNKGIAFFPIFLLLGLLGFNFFSLCISSATSCVVENAPLIKKTIFPRILLPLSVVLSQVIHFLIQLVVLLVFMIIFRVPVTKSYCWLPLVCLVELTFCTGMSLILSLLNVYYRDMLYLVQSALTILFWMTPIFYSLTTVHENTPKIFFGMYTLNPVAGCIDTARKAMLYNSPPDTWAFSAAAAVSVCALLFGLWLYSRYDRNFSDRL
jgi:ABC-type polysaccharide/polyol phosphate export permease